MGVNDPARQSQCGTKRSKMSGEEDRSQLIAHFQVLSCCHVERLCLTTLLLQEVTGITDVERSRATLESHDWNLEVRSVAINLVFPLTVHVFL